MVKEKLFKPVAINTGIPRTKEWLEERRKGIGASDIGAIMGLNPFRSALEVWYEKVYGYSEEEKENVSAETGLALEPLLKEKFQKWFQKNNNNVEMKIEDVPYTLQHPEYSFLRANLDAQFYDPTILDYAVIECKTTNEFGGKQWVEDEIPDSYYLQVQQQLAVTGYHRGYVPFLIGNRSFNVKVINRNEEIIQKIISYTKDFWENFVLKKIPPAPDGTASAGKALDLLYPQEEKGKITEFDVDGSEMAMLQKYDEFNSQAKALESDMEMIRQSIQAKMKDTEIAICGRFKITWKDQVRAAHYVRESRFRMFRILSRKETKK